MTMYGWPSVVAPASYTVTMLGWPDSAPTAAHSRRNLSAASSSAGPARTLIATSRSKVGCQAR